MCLAPADTYTQSLSPVAGMVVRPFALLPQQYRSLYRVMAQVWL